MPPQNHRGITIIAILKLIKGSLLILAAAGAVRLRGHEMEDVIVWIVDHTHLAPEGRLVTWLWDHFDEVTDGKLKMVAQAGFAYGAMQLFEAYGLFLRRKWAEWLVVIATSLPLPFEIYELCKEPSLTRAGILSGNAAIASYLWYRRTDFFWGPKVMALKSRLARYF